MKAIGFFHPGAIEAQHSLIDMELPVPALRPRDLLVRVQAISVNPADVKIRASAQPPEGTARILGYDAAGVVEAVGSGVELFKIGDAVFYAGAINRPGTYAEYHAVDERLVGQRPTALNPAASAALPLTVLTAWELLFERLGVTRRAGHADVTGNAPPGDAILIVNGAGGVGSILTQIARRLTDLTVIATASRPETIAWCKQMGAHYVIDHRQPLNDGLKEIGIPEVRYIAGLTASDQHRDAMIAAIKPQGALALIDDPVHFDVVPFKRKSVSVHWEFMFTRSFFETDDMIRQHQILTEASGLVDRGVLRSTLTKDFGPINANNLKRAHATVEKGRNIGKIVLSGF